MTKLIKDAKFTFRLRKSKLKRYHKFAKDNNQKLSMALESLMDKHIKANKVVGEGEE